MQTSFKSIKSKRFSPVHFENVTVDTSDFKLKRHEVANQNLFITSYKADVAQNKKMRFSITYVFNFHNLAELKTPKEKLLGLRMIFNNHVFLFTQTLSKKIKKKAPLVEKAMSK